MFPTPQWPKEWWLSPQRFWFLFCIHCNVLICLYFSSWVGSLLTVGHGKCQILMRNWDSGARVVINQCQGKEYLAPYREMYPHILLRDLPELDDLQSMITNQPLEFVSFESDLSTYLVSLEVSFEVKYSGAQIIIYIHIKSEYSLICPYSCALKVVSVLLLIGIKFCIIGGYKIWLIILVDLSCSKY